MYKKIIFMCLALSFVIGVSQQAEAKKLNVVCTLPSLASITENVGGEYVKVSSITKGAQDAHYIEAKPSYMVQLSRADLLIYSGMELEIGWLPLLIQGSRNNQVAVGAMGNLNASNALSEEDILQKPRGEIDRSMGDVHPMGNPHYLLNPHLGIKTAVLITERLIALDPENKEEYSANLADFQSVMQDKIIRWQERFAPLKGMQVICYHPHWNYTIDWLGIQNMGFIEDRPGIPPTPKHKMETIKLMRHHNIPIVIVSSWKEPTKAAEVAKASDAELVILPGELGAMGESDEYSEWIDSIIHRLTGAASSVQNRQRMRHRRHIRSGN